MSSPWTKIEPVEGPTSFLEITSEELAKSLQEKEEVRKYPETLVEIQEVPLDSELYEIDGTDSDEVIAHLVQAEFNDEHDLMLKRTENKYNRDSKVNISYSNYRAGPSELEEPKPIIDENRDIDHFVEVEKEYASIPRCGYKKVVNDEGEGSQIVTKHDILMSSRINACRLLEFPPGIETGDTGKFDVKLGNRVFNDLRAHSHAHCSREKAKARLTAKPKEKEKEKEK
ncbi:serine/threonine-protein kinase RIO3 [Belonocnema kinseyi]|uniref:serine/threonine-protein kinase RIO3 n=1 Tax=Belonocnema kinseyi TaxID=2817044 RepID=UPI00143DDE31|nr:serine/threonine-protein kinase RIO3 [Belonocnema kinseyi]